MTTDPTRIRSQPALTTSTGRIWLIVGGIFTGVSLAVLMPMTQLPPPGAIAVATLYIAMIVARIVIPAGRRRLMLLAAATLTIAATAVVTATVVASAATLD
jgi:hypothetical protein